MPKACVKKKMKAGMSKKEAVDACYPKTSKMIEAGKKYGLVKEMPSPAKRKSAKSKKKATKKGY